VSGLGEPRRYPASVSTPPPLFHIVLHEPEIPSNTGNIGRTCIATGCALHLVHPLGFSTSVKACRRAGLDYWPRLKPTEHPSWPAYVAAQEVQPTWFFTTRATRPVWEAKLEPGEHLVFGKETAGLPDAILDVFADRLLTLPMVPGERSLNLATAVCAVVYEGIRQLAARGLVRLSPDGRLLRDG
jgi:tRNA (cytidine/uridine-2'-O-)-methyltransferase